MKIAVLADRLILGGLETHIVTTTNELLRRGHRILLYTAFIEPSILAQIKGEGGRFSQLPWSDEHIRDIAAFDPDMIHAHPFTAIVKGSQAAKTLGKPFVVTMHEYYDFGLDKSALGFEISSTVRAIIAIDLGIAGFLRERVATPEKITVIYNGINLAHFSPAPVEAAARIGLGLDSEWYTVTAVCRFDNGKERPVFQLLRYASALADRLGGLNLILVGGGSWYSRILAEAETLAKEHGNLRINVAGYQAEVRRYLIASDLVIACDRAAMEAMACQRPVLAANAHGYAGIIDAHNYREILFDRQGFHQLSDEALAATHLKLASDTEGRRRAALSGRGIIQEHFDIKATTTQLEQVYEQALK